MSAEEAARPSLQQLQDGPQPLAPAAQPAAAGADASSSYREEVQEGFRQLRALFRAMDAGQEVDMESVRGRPGVVMEPMAWQQLASLIRDGSERALGTLGRHPLGIKRYWDHRDNVLLAQYASVTDYLMLDIFGFQSVLTPDGRNAAVVPPGFFWSQQGGSRGADGSPDERQQGSGDAGGCSSGGGRAAADQQGASNGSIGGGARAEPGTSSSGGGNGSGSCSEAFTLVTKWRDNDFPYNLEPGIRHLNLWANRPLSSREVEAHIADKVPGGAEVTWFVNPPAVQSVPTIWHAHVLYRHQQQQQQ